MEDFDSLKPLAEFVGGNGLTYYVGECGADGSRYSTTDWNAAVNGVCPFHDVGDSSGQGPIGRDD
jgi:hypothetical protein